jgi:hypothetical protein
MLMMMSKEMMSSTHKKNECDQGRAATTTTPTVYNNNDLVLGLPTRKINQRRNEDQLSMPAGAGGGYNKELIVLLLHRSCFDRLLD